MKILILYASKNGATKKCAELLSQMLPSTVTADVVDIKTNVPDLEGYDAVAAGGSIRMGRFDKKLKSFLKQNCERLTSIPCAVFICCGFDENFEDYAETQIPKKLNCSLGVHHFGGELKPDKLKGFDKLVVRAARSSFTEKELEDGYLESKSLPEIIPENIKLLAEEIRKLEESV